MRALGHQAAAALRQPVTGLRLVTDSPRLGEQGRYPLPDDWEPLGYSDAARMADLRRENTDLRARCAEREVEVAHISRQLEVAREDGRREERAVKARTMGGRVLSILVAGSGR